MIWILMNRAIPNQSASSIHVRFLIWMISVSWFMVCVNLLNWRCRLIWNCNSKNLIVFINVYYCLLIILLAYLCSFVLLYGNVCNYCINMLNVLNEFAMISFWKLYYMWLNVYLMLMMSLKVFMCCIRVLLILSC